VTVKLLAISMQSRQWKLQTRPLPSVLSTVVTGEYSCPGVARRQLRPSGLVDTPRDVPFLSWNWL